MIPARLDEVHDLLKLLGMVIGQITLLSIATNASSDPKTLAAKVAAARALVNLKESPDDIADRLRRSPFADLTTVQLEAIVAEVKKGNTDLGAIITSLKEQPDGNRTSTPHS